MKLWRRLQQWMHSLQEERVSSDIRLPEGFCDWFDFAARAEGEIFRELDGRRTYRIVIEGQGYFIKYHSGIGWGEIFKNLVLMRVPVVSAAVELRAIRMLESCGVGTMKAVGFGRRGWNPARVESFLITDELAPTRSLEELVLAGDLAGKPALKWQLLAAVADMARRMHVAGMNHRDLYLCHFLLNTDELAAGRLRLSLIDLHRALFHDHVPTRWRNKDLASLYFSAMDAGLTRTDKVRFLKQYFGLPLREILALEKESLVWLEKESVRLRAKFLRKYAPVE